MVSWENEGQAMRGVSAQVPTQKSMDMDWERAGVSSGPTRGTVMSGRLETARVSEAQQLMAQAEETRTITVEIVERLLQIEELSGIHLSELHADTPPEKVNHPVSGVLPTVVLYNGASLSRLGVIHRALCELANTFRL